jgi:hypothetical protein
VLATGAIVVLVPLVALTVLVALVGAIVTAPYLLVRVAVGSVRARRAARGSVTVPMPAADMWP